MMLNGLPWKETEIILFLRLHPNTAFQALVDYDGYSISSKGFLPSVVDIMSSELNFLCLVCVISLVVNIQDVVEICGLFTKVRVL